MSWTAIRNLIEFADKLEKATLATIESGKMTKDLALITTLEDVTVLNSRDFILAIRERLDEMFNNVRNYPVMFL